MNKKVLLASLVSLFSLNTSIRASDRTARPASIFSFVQLAIAESHRVCTDRASLHFKEELTAFCNRCDYNASEGEILSVTKTFARRIAQPILSPIAIRSAAQVLRDNPGHAIHIASSVYLGIPVVGRISPALSSSPRLPNQCENLIREALYQTETLHSLGDCFLLMPNECADQIREVLHQTHNLVDCFLDSPDVEVVLTPTTQSKLEVAVRPCYIPFSELYTVRGETEELRRHFHI